MIGTARTDIVLIIGQHHVNVGRSHIYANGREAYAKGVCLSLIIALVWEMGRPGPGCLVNRKNISKCRYNVIGLMSPRFKIM